MLLRQYHPVQALIAVSELFERDPLRRVRREFPPNGAQAFPPTRYRGFLTPRGTRVCLLAANGVYLSNKPVGGFVPPPKRSIPTSLPIIHSLQYLIVSTNHGEERADVPFWFFFCFLLC